MTLYFSRLRLSQSPSVRALDALLNPEGQGPRLDAHHRLIWAAFADTPDRRRDFLWRDDGKGGFLALSARPPLSGDLFEVDVKHFAPVLSVGDRLAFSLRANATRDRKGKGRVDVVIDALHALPKGERADHRMDIAQREGADWLARQGTRGGFRVVEVAVGDYSVAALPDHKGKRAGQPQFGILDLSGVIEVTNPAAFVASLAIGFGRARAFGCGLMLIRRAE
jgi:CRISPR system Cascade subunit CasE